MSRNTNRSPLRLPPPIARSETEYILEQISRLIDQLTNQNELDRVRELTRLRGQAIEAEAELVRMREQEQQRIAAQARFQAEVNERRRLGQPVGLGQLVNRNQRQVSPLRGQVAQAPADARSLGNQASGEAWRLAVPTPVMRPRAGRTGSPLRQPPTVLLRELHAIDIDQLNESLRRSFFIHNRSEEITFENASWSTLLDVDQQREYTFSISFISRGKRFVIYKLFKPSTIGIALTAVFIDVVDANQRYEIKPPSQLARDFETSYTLPGLFKSIQRTPMIEREETEEFERIDNDFGKYSKEINVILEEMYRMKGAMPF